MVKLVFPPTKGIQLAKERSSYPKLITYLSMAIEFLGEISTTFFEIFREWFDIQIAWPNLAPSVSNSLV